MIYQFNLSFSLSLLFMGFLLANIFGIMTSSKNIIFLFVLCIELINCFIYSKTIKKTSKFSQSLFSRGYRFRSYFVRSPMRSSLDRLQRNQSAADPSKAYTAGRPRVLDEYFLLIWLRLIRFTYYVTSFGRPKVKVVIDDFKRLKSIDHNINFKIVISTIVTSLNFLKIGFEFGFFIDAFKLGS